MPDIDPLHVIQIREHLLTWLRHNAVPEWAQIMDQGIRFIAPPEGEGLNGEELATFLARAERDRLKSSQLYHVDAAATRQAVAQVATMGVEDVLTPQTLPSPAGLMVWTEDISRTESGIPIIAVSWGVLPDAKVWVSWWSDAVYAARRMFESGQFTADQAEWWLSLRGVLAFERERILPFTAESSDDPFAFPSVFEEPADIKVANLTRAMTRVTIATWQMITTGQVSVEERAASRQIRRRLAADGLSTTVHAVQG